ncbi:zinc transporter protein, partial [Cladorrhinum sp. PSN332]
EGKKDRTGLRISAIFTILVTSTFLTMFPLWAKRTRWLPLWALIFARYFGAGVIIATAFIHLLSPAFEAIGPMSCVGVTGGWQNYPWPVAITMTSFMLVFLMGFGSEWYLERRFDHNHSHQEQQGDPEGNSALSRSVTNTPRADSHQNHQFLHSSDQDAPVRSLAASPREEKGSEDASPSRCSTADTVMPDAKLDMAVRNQIISFCVLEFGVMFHSVIIGLNLGVTGRELPTLFPVVAVHQAFEGLGIGARLSMIPFSKRLRWIPWTACILYGLTTPVAIAIGMGIANQYNPASFKAKIVSGVLDSISAGILMYTGLVELLARDFLFNPDRTRDNKQISLMLVCLLSGVGLMALLGRWA